MASLLEWGLAAFLIWTAYQRLTLVWHNFGLDARIYINATQAWLTGSDPWLAGPPGFQFNATPPTLLAMLPFAILPGDLGAAVFMGTCVAAAIYVIRTLRLPWYWLFFLPVVEGVWSGNPNIVVVAAILVGLPWLGALFKLYALIPILTDRRALATAIVVLGVTAPLVPWLQFAREAQTILGHHASQNSEAVGAWEVPILLIPTAIALLALPRREAAWLAVPTLWPVAPLSYGTFILPVANPLFAIFVSSDRKGLSSIAVILYAIWRHELALKTYATRAIRTISTKRRVVESQEPAPGPPSLNR